MTVKQMQIINAARELFSTYGYKKVTMDEIAKEAGVTKKTIYTYFKDKDDLLKYFIKEEIGKMKKLVEDIQSENLPFVETIHKMIYALISYTKEDKLLVLLSREAESMPLTSVKECLGMFTDATLSELKDMLERAIKEKHIRKCDTEITAFIIYKIYLSLLFEWEKPLDSQKITKELVQFLKHGLLI